MSETEDQEFAIGAGLAPFAATLLMLPIVFYQTLFYRPLWGWFAVPLGLPNLGMAPFAGLTLLIVAAFNRDYTFNKEVEAPVWKRILVAMVMPPAYFLTGWIVHLFT